MELIDFKNHARYFLDRENLNHWSIDFHPFDMPAGNCNWQGKSLSFSLTWIAKMPDEKVMETLLHEIAHAKTALHPLTPPDRIPLDFWATGGHTLAWEKECKRLGGSGIAHIPDEDIVLFLGKEEGTLSDMRIGSLYFKRRKQYETRKFAGSFRKYKSVSRKRGLSGFFGRLYRKINPSKPS